MTTMHWTHGEAQAIRTWLRSSDRTTGIVLLVLGLFLASSALTMMFTG